MSELISTPDFHRTDGTDGWRVVAGGPTLHYPTGTYAAGAALVQAITGLGTAGGREPHVDLRPEGMTYGCRSSGRRVTALPRSTPKWPNALRRLRATLDCRLIRRFRRLCSSLSMR